MATVLPEGEAIRKAVKWISSELEEQPDRSRRDLVNEAIMRFDLSPRDAEFLTNFYRQEKSGSSSA